MKKSIFLLAAIAFATNINTIVVNTKVNNGFAITLPEHKTAGYTCKLANYDDDVIIPAGVTQEKGEAIGAPNQKTWSFRTITTNLPQTTHLTLACERPWDKENPQNHNYSILIS